MSGALTVLAAAEDAATIVRRAPDRRWTRRDWKVVECWVVDLGRPWGVRLDWRLNGETKEPMHFSTPAEAHLDLMRWERRDTTAPAVTHKSGRMRPGRRR